MVKHDKTDEIICPDGASFLQFVSDNTDPDLATPDGQNTRHGLDTVAIANGKFLNCLIQRQKIPRDNMEKWLDIKSNNGIKIVQYYTQHFSINKNSFTTKNSGNTLISYYYLKVIDFREVKNFTFHEDLFSHFGYF